MSSLETLLAKDEILDTVNDLFTGTDARDWGRVRGALADRVRFDMTSLAGGEPATLAAEEIVRAWEDGLRPIRHVHHQTGNFHVRVDGDRAAVSCYGIALHHRPAASGRSLRTFVGSYDLGLAKESGRWRITSFRFDLKFVHGNLELEKEA